MPDVDDTPTPLPDGTPPTWRQRIRSALVAVASNSVVQRAALALVAAILGSQGCPRTVIDVVERVEFVERPANDDPPAPPPEDARFAMGWVRDDDAVKELAAKLPQPVFANTPAGQVGDVPDHIYLWDYAKSAIGRHIPTRNQLGVGSCVSFGSACAVEYQMCVIRVQALKAGQPPPEFKDVAQEIIYGGSRVQIGKGQIRGDGSLGIWGAQFCRDYGVVARGKYDGYDLTNYSESMCRKLGNTGCPQSLIPEAKKHPTRSISQVRTVEDAKKALASLYPVTIASDVGFGTRGPYVRNAKGQLRASGSWPHQMCLIGYDKDSGFYCMNSWGSDWVSGPTGPGNPPPGGFYIEETTVARILSQGDSWAYGDQVGFPSRRLDWLVRGERLGDSLPSLAIHDAPDLFPVDAVHRREFPRRGLPFGRQSADFLNIRRQQLRSPVAFPGVIGAVQPGVGTVSGRRVPSQIVESVVPPVPVAVTAPHSDWSRPREHGQNQDVNRETPPTTIVAGENHVQVSVGAGGRLELPPTPITVAGAGTPHGAIAADAVTGECWNVLVDDRTLSFSHDLPSLNQGVGCGQGGRSLAATVPPAFIIDHISGQVNMSCARTLTPAIRPQHLLALTNKPEHALSW
jgi:hypothetical protein